MSGVKERAEERDRLRAEGAAARTREVVTRLESWAIDAGSRDCRMAIAAAIRRAYPEAFAIPPTKGDP